MSTWYVTQSGAGSQNGVDVDNAYAMTDIDGTDWSALTNPIVAGDTVQFSGTLTYAGILQITGDGTEGSRITFDFTGISWDVGGFATRNISLNSTGGDYTTFSGGTFEGGTTDAIFHRDKTPVTFSGGTYKAAIQFDARTQNASGRWEDVTFDATAWDGSRSDMLELQMSGTDHAATTSGVLTGIVVTGCTFTGAAGIGAISNFATNDAFYNLWNAGRIPQSFQYTGNYTTGCQSSPYQCIITAGGSTLSFNNSVDDGGDATTNVFQMGGNDDAIVADSVATGYTTSTSGDGNGVIWDRVPTSSENENPSRRCEANRIRFKPGAGTSGNGCGVSFFRARDCRMVSCILDTGKEGSRIAGTTSGVGSGDYTGNAIYQCTIYNATVAGHAAKADSEAHSYINNIVHTAPEGIYKTQASGVLPTETNNCLHNITNNEINDNGTPVSIDSSSFTTDPLLIDPANSDFRLQPASPCARAGTKWWSTVPNDYEGYRFPLAGDDTMDMGAHVVRGAQKAGTVPAGVDIAKARDALARPA